MFRYVLPLVFGLALVAGPNIAQDAPEAPAAEAETAVEPGVAERLRELVETARESSEDDHRYNLETLSCGEFEQLAHSERQADQAVVSMLMVWSHGYKSGLEGLDFEARPVSLDGLTELTHAAMEECSQHPEMLFHVAVGRIG